MKKLEDYEWICPEPFTNALYSVSGNIKPCCSFKPAHKILKKHNWSQHFHSSTDTFDSYYNSDQMKRLRAAMRNGGDDEFLEDVCQVCKTQERSGNRSDRQFRLSKFSDNNIFSNRKEELERIIATDSPPTFFHRAEINGTRGNVCNLRCNFCSSVSSSSYNKEEVDLGESSIRLKTKPDTNDQFEQELKTIVNMSDELKFTGGEPLIGNGVYDLLDSIKDPTKKGIRIVTNGTQDVDRFIDSTKNFKRVTVNVSIDGYGDFNNYLRYPSEWSMVNGNITKLMRSNHIKLYMVSTVNAINVGRIYELCDHFGDSFVAGSYVSNNFYRINSIPPSIKDQYLNKLYTYGKHREVKKIIKYLENVEWDEEGMYGMLSHIKRRDIHRNTSLLEFAPEWKTYYENIVC